MHLRRRLIVDLRARGRLGRGDQRSEPEPCGADLDRAGGMELGPCLADAVPIDRRRGGLVRALQEERGAVEVEERVDVEDARRLDAPHPLLADADGLELLPEGERDEGGLPDARLDLDNVSRRRFGHSWSGNYVYVSRGSHRRAIEDQ